MSGPHLPADRHPHSRHDPLRPRAGRPPRRPRTAARQTLRRPSTPPSSPPCSGVTRGSFQVTSQGPGGPACSQSTPSVPPAPAARATRGPVVSARSPPPPPAWPLPAGPSRCTRFGHTEAPKLLPALPGGPLPTSLPRPRGPSAGPRRPQTLWARPPSCPPCIARQLECAEENRGPGRPCAVPEARRQPPGELGELGPLLHDAALRSLLEALATVPILGPHRGEPQLPASAPSAHLPLPDPGALMAATWTWPWSLSYSASQQFGVQRTPPSLETRCPRWLRTLHSLCLSRHRLLLTGSFPGSQGRPATRALPAAGPRPVSPCVPGNVSRACAHSNIVISHTNLSPPQSSLCPASSSPAARRQSREGPPPDTLPSTHCLSALWPLRPAFRGHTTLSAPAPLESSSN